MKLVALHDAVDFYGSELSGTSYEPKVREAVAELAALEALREKARAALTLGEGDHQLLINLAREIARAQS